MMSSAYPRITENRGDYLADRVIYLMLRLFEGLGYGEYDLTTYRYRDKNWYFKFDFINIADNIIMLDLVKI